MDVRCPQCETLYEVEERQLRGGGATLKCSQCDHVFRLQTSLSLNQENRRRWMLRNKNTGDILYFSAFDQLHKWIMNGEVGKDDAISRTGDRWTRLEDIGEFMPVFKAVDSISSLNNAPAVQRAQGIPDGAGSSPSNPGGLGSVEDEITEHAGQSDSAPHPRPETGQRSRVRTSQQFPLDAEPHSPPGKSRSDGSGPSQPPGQGPGRPADGSGPKSARASRAERQRSPSNSGSQPAIERSPSESGMRTPVSDRSGSAQGESSGPQIDTGPVGGPETSGDDWSFGDSSGLQDAPRQTTGEFDASYSDSGSRWPWVVLIVVLILGGGAAALYLVEPELVQNLITTSETTVPIQETSESEDETAESSAETASPQDVVSTALDAARTALGEREAELLGESIVPARRALYASRAEAKEAADKEAEEPDPDEMLARARRLLERGDSNRARKKYHEVLELERSNIEAITGLGWSLLGTGSPSAAAAQFRRATSINPSYGDAYIGLGKAERELGNKRAAMEAYSSYLSRVPGGSKSSIAKYQKEKLEAELEE